MKVKSVPRQCGQAAMAMEFSHFFNSFFSYFGAGLLACEINRILADLHLSPVKAVCGWNH